MRKSQDPRDAKYYQDLMAGVVRDVYKLLFFVEARKLAQQPLTSATKLQNGNMGQISPSTLLQQMKRDFAFLATRVAAQEFTEDWENEMVDALRVWGTWQEPDNDDSWLLPQLAFRKALEDHMKEFRDGTTWRLAFETGLKPGAQRKMANEPLASLMSRLESLSSENSKTQFH
jgi:hypothetical protein